MKYTTQEKASHYFTEQYIDQNRWSSYYHQINLVREIAKKRGKNKLNILEVGPGNGLVTTVLRFLGHSVSTMDFDTHLKPDILMALPDVPTGNMYDCVLCCEVLEHLRYADSQKSLQWISTIARFAVISVPQKGIQLSYSLKTSLFPRIRGIVSIPFSHISHTFRFGHYWELGTKGISERVFKKAITDAGYIVLADTRPAENPYHHFYLLRSTYEK